MNDGGSIGLLVRSGMETWGVCMDKGYHRGRSIGRSSHCVGYRELEVKYTVRLHIKPANSFAHVRETLSHILHRNAPVPFFVCIESSGAPQSSTSKKHISNRHKQHRPQRRVPREPTSSRARRFRRSNRRRHRAPASPQRYRPRRKRSLQAQRAPQPRRLRQPASRKTSKRRGGRAPDQRGAPHSLRAAVPGARLADGAAARDAVVADAAGLVGGAVVAVGVAAVVAGGHAVVAADYVVGVGAGAGVLAFEEREAEGGVEVESEGGGEEEEREEGGGVHFRWRVWGERGEECVCGGALNSVKGKTDAGGLVELRVLWVTADRRGNIYISSRIERQGSQPQPNMVLDRQKRLTGNMQGPGLRS
jgi:hypothetical protein